MKNLFNLRSPLSKKNNLLITIVGSIIILSVWTIIPSIGLVSPYILPTPFKILCSFKELHFQDELVRNLAFSIYLNLSGYLEAVAISLLIGFPLGLFTPLKSLFSGYFNATRFIPLPAITGIFIGIFGIYTNMKVQFLAVGIIVYLVPVVIQRVEEVEEVYEQTAITLGASIWQRIVYVFIPSVMSKIMVDIKVLVAISWTYIIYAEMVNATAGVGKLAYLAQRQSRYDKMYAIMLIIIGVGFLQDKLFEIVDKKLFPYKYL